MPPEIRIHPVFHVELLEKYMPPQDGQEPPASVPVVVDGHEWEIDEILGGKTRHSRPAMVPSALEDGGQTTEPATHLNHLATLIIVPIDINISQFTLPSTSRVRSVLCSFVVGVVGRH